MMLHSLVFWNCLSLFCNDNQIHFRFPLAIIHLNTTWRSSIFLRFETNLSSRFEVILVIGLYLVDSSVTACFVTFFELVCNCFNLFSSKSYSIFRPKTIRSGRLLDFRGSSVYRLLKSWSSSPLLGKIDTLRFGPSLMVFVYLNTST